MNCDRNSHLHSHRYVGDPIDAVTGANTETAKEFELPGVIPFRWRRHYDSSRAQSRYSLGWGRSHAYECQLRFDADGMRYAGPLGFTLGFPTLARDGSESSRAGFTLRRVSSMRYQLGTANEPALEFEFENPDRPVWVSSLVASGARARFQYSTAGVLQAVECSGRFVRVNCDEEGRIISLALAGTQERPDRVLIAYEYDSAGNLVRGTDAYGHSFSFEYDAHNRVTRRTDRRGYSFFFSYDTAGRCIHSRGEDGHLEVRLDYRPEARCTFVTQADGGVWTYRYDDHTFLTAIVDPYGGVRSYKKSDDDTVELEIDPSGDVSRWEYGPDGSLLGIRTSLGHMSSEEAGRLRPDQRAHRVPSRPSEWEYGDLVTATDTITSINRTGSGSHPPESLRRLMTYFGRSAAQGLDRGGPSSGDGSWAYATPVLVNDDLGLRLREVAHGGHTRLWSYDAGGNAVRYQDFDGGMIRCEYTSWDLPVSRTDSLGRIVRKRFSKTGKITEVIDPGGTTTKYVWDLKGRLSELWYNGSRIEQYRYDAGNNLTARLDNEGRALLTQEFGLKNLKTLRRLASGELHRFAYTDRGYFAEIVAGELVTKFDYDEFGNCTHDARNGKGVEHTFHRRGTVDRSVILKRFRVHYRRAFPDALEIKDPGGKCHYVYFFADRVVGREMSNGLSELTQYDMAGRTLCKLSSTLHLNDSPWMRNYSYSDEGDLHSARDNKAGTVRYEYDSAHRLQLGGVGNGPPERFRHDVNDNLLEQPGLTGVTISAGNRLRFANGCEFQYDHRGNIESRRGPHGETRFQYDSRNMMVRCELNGHEWTAAYDPLGRRVRKTSNGATWEFYWDGDRLVAEINPDGALRIYLYADAFAIVPLLWLEYDSVDSDPGSGRRYFIVCNHQGTPVCVEDEQRRIVWQAKLSPYGTATLPSNPTVHMPIRFPGHYYDEETRLHYNRLRYYSPELGRYLQPDPVGTSAGNNPYAYSSNPLRYVDVRGDCPTDGTKDDKGKTNQAGDPAEGGEAEPGKLPPNTLTDQEAAQIQALADKHQTQIDVIGSRADGRGRNIDSDLPVGKGDGTRSDIDFRYDGQADIDSGGRFTNQLSNVGNGAGAPSFCTGPGGSKPPVIIFRPNQPPEHRTSGDPS